MRSEFNLALWYYSLINQSTVGKVVKTMSSAFDLFSIIDITENTEYQIMGDALTPPIRGRRLVPGGVCEPVLDRNQPPPSPPIYSRSVTLRTALATIQGWRPAPGAGLPIALYAAQ